MDNLAKDIAKQWGKLWATSPNDELDMRDHKIRYKFQIFQSLLDKLPENPRVLEVGCGNGQWLRLLKKYHPGAELYGVDISEDAVSICKKHGIDAVFGDARSLPLKNDFFDFVFSFGTVEHFPETKQALLEHIRILKPGGYAWIEVPNAWSLPGLHTYLGNLVHRRDPYRVMVEQGKRYSMRAIKKMAHASPQRIFVRVQGSGDCVPYMRYFMWLDRMMPGVFRRFFGGNVGVIVGKK